MAEVEASHWWYRALRDVLGRCLAQPDLALPERPAVLDAGCGTGENLRFLEQRLAPGYLGGFDASTEALAFAREKVPDADLYPGDVCAPELHVDSLDLVISMDVIYIPGAARATPGLATLARALRPGGLLVLNLPAYDWLYSEHDLAIHTKERYTESRVRALLDELGLERARSSHRLCFLFPLVVLTRLPSMWRARRKSADEAQSDLHSVPGGFTNRVLGAVSTLENVLVARGTHLPFGSSVFAIGRKPR